MSARPIPASGSTNKREKRQLYAMATVGVLFLLSVLVFSTLYFGYVKGQEFAADTFNRREFAFYQIPLLGLQITPIDRKDVTNDLESYLVTQKLISTKATPDEQKRWDLIFAQRGLSDDSPRLLSQGEARILAEYLDAADPEGNRIWLDWTKSNQAIAKVVWPAVAQVARQELYLFAPELLILARNATDGTELQETIDALLADKYLAFGRIHQELGNHQPAIELFTSSLAHGPTRAETLRARAKSLTALGKGDLAAADIRQAEELTGGGGVNQAEKPD